MLKIRVGIDPDRVYTAVGESSAGGRISWRFGHSLKNTLKYDNNVTLVGYGPFGWQHVNKTQSVLISCTFDKIIQL